MTDLPELNVVHCADVVEFFDALPDGCIQCVVTSPPYWGLRVYGTPPMVWGGDSDCEHEWASGATAEGETYTSKKKWQHGHTRESNPEGWKVLGTNRNFIDEGGRGSNNPSITSESAFCCRCGAWRGHYGLEPTIGLYVEHTVMWMRALRPKLRADGTVWLNLGDSYASIGRSPRQESPGVGATQAMPRVERDVTWEPGGGHNFSWTLPGHLKPKDLVMMPARVALALQAGFHQCENCGHEMRSDLWPVRSGHRICWDCYDAGREGRIVRSEQGWWLRSDIVWAKPNPMPESVTDRPTKAHEYVFLLSKAKHYFYDADAVREVQDSAEKSRFYVPRERKLSEEARQNISAYASARPRDEHGVFLPQGKDSRNPGDGYQGQLRQKRPPRLLNPAGRNLRSVWHFAMAPCPYMRMGAVEDGDVAQRKSRAFCDAYVGGSTPPISTIWKLPTAPYSGAHFATYPPKLVERCVLAGTKPGDIVCDPFAGTATTGVVAVKHGRDFLGCDLMGGDKDFGKGPGGVEHHTANERLAAAGKGLTLREHLEGQMTLLEP